MIIEAVTYEFRVNYNLEKGGCENVLWIGWFIPQNGLFWTQQQTLHFMEGTKYMCI